MLMVVAVLFCLTVVVGFLFMVVAEFFVYDNGWFFVLMVVVGFLFMVVAIFFFNIIG